MKGFGKYIRAAKPMNFGAQANRAFANEVAPYGIRFGTPGRSANSGITATVFGGYGFIGRYFIEELGARGSRVYVPFRGCELEIRHLKPMFDLGQLGLLPFSIRDKDSIKESLQYSDVVVNMIGKHYETKHLVPTRRSDGKLSQINYSFEEVHVDAARRIAELAKEAGVKTLIHVSSLAADVNSPCRWARTKAQGELAVREAFPEAIIVKLATVFGPEDRFLNMIAETTKKLPFFPLVDGGSALTQPVFANDVGKALNEIVNDHEMYEGKTFQLAGPAEYSYKELAEFVSDITTQRKPLLDVPAATMHAFAKAVEFLPNPWITDDYVSLLQQDVLMKDDAEAAAAGGEEMLTFQDLGIEPTSMDKAAFDYLHRYRPGGHFTLVTGYH